MTRHLMVVLALVAAVNTAEAAPISYTATFSGSGKLGGTDFTDAVVTFELVGNTVHVKFQDNYFVNVGKTTVTIDGMGTATFFDRIDVVSEPAGFGEFSEHDTNFVIVGIASPAFESYDLSTSFGPVSGPAQFFGADFFTDRGRFNLHSVSGSMTFTAVAGVPEPGITMLLVTGVLGLARARWRGQASTQRRIERSKGGATNPR